MRSATPTGAPAEDSRVVVQYMGTESPSEYSIFQQFPSNSNHSSKEGLLKATQSKVFLRKLSDIRIKMERDMELVKSRSRAD